MRRVRILGFEEYARWGVDFLRRHGLREVTVIGHSTSGPVAALVGQLAPELVAGIVLVDTVGAQEEKSLLRIGLRRGVEALLDPRFSCVALPDLLRNLWFHTRNFVYLVWLSCTADARAIFASVQQPVLSLWRKGDLTFPPRVAEALQRQMRGARLFTGRGRHDWLEEHPEEFLGVLRGARFSSANI